MTSQFYIIYAKWCGHCTELLKTMSKIIEDNKDIKDINSNVEMIEQTALTLPETKEVLGDIEIVGYPTILINENNVLTEYNGPRDQDSLTKLFNANKVTGGARKTTKKTTKKTKRKPKRKPKRTTTRKPKRKTTKSLFDWLR